MGAHPGQTSPPPGRQTPRASIRIAAGLLCSGALLWLALRQADTRAMGSSLAAVEAGCLAASVLLFIAAQALRAVRLRVLLGPEPRTGLGVLFPVACVSYAAAAWVPLHLGEAVRPLLLNRRCGTPPATAVAVALLERILDVAALAAILVLFSLTTGLAPEVDGMGLVRLLRWLVLAGAAVALSLWLTRRAWWPLLAGSAPAAWTRRCWGGPLEELGRTLTPRRLAAAMAVSMAVWGLGGLGIHVLLAGFGLDLPLAAFVVIQLTTVAGISLPSAPGYVGNFHYGAMAGLLLYGVHGGVALSFAVLYHLAGVGVLTLLGLAFLPWQLPHLRRRTPAPRG